MLPIQKPVAISSTPGGSITKEDEEEAQSATVDVLLNTAALFLKSDEPSPVGKLNSVVQMVSVVNILTNVVSKSQTDYQISILVSNLPLQ